MTVFTVPSQFTGGGDINVDNDTNSLQNWLDTVPDGAHTVVFPPATYRIQKGGKGYRLVFRGSGWTIQASGAHFYQPYWPRVDGTEAERSVLEFTSASNMELVGAEVSGIGIGVYDHSFHGGPSGTVNHESCCGIMFRSSVSHIKLNNVHVHHVLGDCLGSLEGISVGPIWVVDSELNHPDRMLVGIVGGCTGYIIQRSHLHHGPRTAIDIEFGGNSVVNINDFCVEDCIIGPWGAGFNLVSARVDHSRIKRFGVRNNLLDDAGSGGRALLRLGLLRGVSATDRHEYIDVYNNQPLNAAVRSRNGFNRELIKIQYARQVRVRDNNQNISSSSPSGPQNGFATNLDSALVVPSVCGRDIGNNNWSQGDVQYYEYHEYRNGVLDTTWPCPTPQTFDQNAFDNRFGIDALLATFDTTSTYIALPFLDETATLYPLKAFRQKFTLPHLDASAVFYTPRVTVDAGTIDLDLLDESAVFYAPLLSGGGSVGSLDIDADLDLDVVFDIDGLFGFDQLDLELLDESAVFYDPVVTVGAATVSLPFLDESAIFYALTVTPAGTQNVVLDLLDESAVFYDLTVTVAQQINLDLLDESAVFYALSLAVEELLHLFSPPLVDDVPRVETTTKGVARRLFIHFVGQPRGINVFKLTDGSYTEEQPYDYDLIDTWYMGGHSYNVTAEETAALRAAGYAVTGP